MSQKIASNGNKVTNTTTQVRIKIRHDLLEQYSELSDVALSYTLNNLLQAHIAVIGNKNESKIY